MEWLIPIISKIENVAILVPVLCLGGLGYLYVTERRENRVDRQALMDLMLKTTDALNGLRNVLSALTGKSL